DIGFVATQHDPRVVDDVGAGAGARELEVEGVGTLGSVSKNRYSASRGAQFDRCRERSLNLRAREAQEGGSCRTHDAQTGYRSDPNEHCAAIVAASARAPRLRLLQERAPQCGRK